MQTNSIHIFSSYLPVWMLIIAIILFGAGIILKNEKYTGISFWFILAGIVAALFTGAMGGASMAKTEVLPDINNSSLHIHTWTAAIAIVFFLLSGFFSLRRRKKLKLGKAIGTTNVLILVFLSGSAIFLFWTIHVSHQVRL